MILADLIHDFMSTYYVTHGFQKKNDFLTKIEKKPVKNKIKMLSVQSTRNSQSCYNTIQLLSDGRLEFRTESVQLMHCVPSELVYVRTHHHCIFCSKSTEIQQQQKAQFLVIYFANSTCVKTQSEVIQIH
jgi:hypothetical protein